MNNIENEVRLEYFAWLVNLVEGYDNTQLLEYLHDIPFRWILPNDENRADDGCALRDRFLYETNYTDYDLPEKECSVLEMLAALANRINDILIDIEDYDDTPRWFWELLENLQIDEFDDMTLTSTSMYDIVDDSINTFMDRLYDRNGFGGLFPLKNAKDDQRDIELWYQMSAYLEENYSENDDY